jgi:hypothetical protein
MVRSELPSEFGCRSKLFSIVTQRLEALCMGLPGAVHSNRALVAADALAVAVLICFLNGSLGINALEHRSRYAMQGWIKSGQRRGDRQPNGKVADIGTLLRRAMHRSRRLSITPAIALRIRWLHYSTLGTHNRRSPPIHVKDRKQIHRAVEAVLQLAEAAMLRHDTNWPDPALCERFCTLLTEAKVLLNRSLLPEGDESPTPRIRNARCQPGAA